MLAGLLFFTRIKRSFRVFLGAGLASLILNLYLNWFFYPDLMQYQSGDVAAAYINRYHPGIPGVRMGLYSPGFEFYLKDTMMIADTNTIKEPGAAKNGVWLISEEGLAFIQQRHIPYELLKEFSEFHVTMLTLKFINKKTTGEGVEKNVFGAVAVEKGPKSEVRSPEPVVQRSNLLLLRSVSTSLFLIPYCRQSRSNLFLILEELLHSFHHHPRRYPRNTGSRHTGRLPVIGSADTG